MNPFGDDFLSDEPKWLPARQAENQAPRLNDKTEGNLRATSGIGSLGNWVASIAVFATVSLVDNAASTSARSAHASQAARAATSQASTPMNERDIQWEAYLLSLQKPSGRFSARHIEAVRALWQYARKLNPQIAPPQCGPAGESALELVWDLGRHHIEVDVHANERADWFYSNRESGVFEGNDNCEIGQLPKRLGDYIKTLV